MPTITLEVPDELYTQLDQMRDQLPDILIHGLLAVQANDNYAFAEASDIIALLTSQPTPEQILAIRPSPTMDARIDELLERNKEPGLTTEENIEFERYRLLEHIVGMAKAKALKAKMHHKST